MSEKTWVDYFIAIGSITTPILILALTGIGWKYRQVMERKLKLEEQLRDDRIEIYNKILEPFILLLMSETAWKSDKNNKNKDKNELAASQMLTLEYRKVSFKLSLLGSDAVLTAYNNLMQYFYNRSNDAQKPTIENLGEIMALLGSFLLEIRRSMGNESTKIDNWGMLEWFITDARKMRAGSKSG